MVLVGLLRLNITKVVEQTSQGKMDLEQQE